MEADTQKALSGGWRAKKKALTAWIWSDSIGGNRPALKILQTFARVSLIFFREFNLDKIGLRSAALTFTVLLSMVPVLALATSVLKGLGAGGQMRSAAYQFIEKTEHISAVPASPVNVPQTEDGSSSQGPSQPAPPPDTLTSHLKSAVDTVFDYVDRTNFAALGVLGIAGLLFTVISMMDAIESAMNVIWTAQSARPIGRKVMDYLAFMILLPVAVNIGVAAMASLQTPAALGIIRHIFPVPWAGPLFVNLLTLSVMIATLVIMYRFLPNTKVPFLPAFVGALVAGVGWLIIQGVFIRLQIGVSKYNAIYGSFATLPLFLLWIHMGWLVFLSGAEVAFAVHVHKRYSRGGSELNPLAALALAFDVLACVFRDFRERKITDPVALAARLGCPEGSVDNVTRKLLAAGLLRRVEGREGDGLGPGTSAPGISAMEVVEVIFGDEARPTPGGRAAHDALTGIRGVLRERTVEELVIVHQGY